jgi:centromeric protein E
MRPKRDVQPLLPFEELVNETDVAQNESCKEEEHKKNTVGDRALPDPCALLHVTSRRKLPPRTKKLTQVALSTLHSLEQEFWLFTF